MCEPTSLAIASFALTGGSAVLENQAQDKASKANAAAARAGGVDPLNALALRGTQETDAATQQAVDAQRAGRAAISNALLAAGENGVAGNSVDAAVADTRNQVSTASGTIQSNLAATLSQLDSEAVGVNSRTQSRINAVPMGNPFATGLKIVGAGIDTAARLKSYRPAVG